MAGRMVISIVHPEDAPEVIHALNKDGFRVTQSATTGGFLRQGNVTLLTGVEEGQVDQVMNIIRTNTRPRSHKGWWRRPGKYQTGAATIFVLKMERAKVAD